MNNEERIDMIRFKCKLNGINIEHYTCNKCNKYFECFDLWGKCKHTKYYCLTIIDDEVFIHHNFYGSIVRFACDEFEIDTVRRIEGPVGMEFSMRWTYDKE